MSFSHFVSQKNMKTFFGQWVSGPSSLDKATKGFGQAKNLLSDSSSKKDRDS